MFMRSIALFLLGTLLGWLMHLYFITQNIIQTQNLSKIEQPYNKNPEANFIAQKPRHTKPKKIDWVRKANRAMIDKDLELSMFALQKVIENAPYDAETLMLANDVYTDNGEYLLALEALENLLNQVQDKFDEQAIIARFLSVTRLYLGTLGDADILKKRDFLYKIVNILPEHLQLRAQLGKVLLGLRNFDEAEDQLNFLADNKKWQVQFDELKEDLNYAKIFQQGDVKIPLIYRAGGWRIETEIDGKKAILLVDTGANITSLSDHLVDKDTLKNAKTISVNTANGITRGSIIDLKKFKVGEVIREKFKVAVLPKSNLPPEIDGLLGTDWLAYFHFVINKKQSILHLKPTLNH